MVSSSTAPNTRVADRLVSEGAITAAIRQKALDRAKAQGQAMVEALIELEAIDEASLLGHIAKWYSVETMSAEQLSQARVDGEALSSVPREVADRLGIYPLELDRGARRLVIATADAGNTAAVRELKKEATVRDVRQVVARPAAIVAARARGYDKDEGAFSKLVPPAPAGAGAADKAPSNSPADFTAALDGLGQSSVPAKPEASTEGAHGRATHGPSDSDVPEPVSSTLKSSSSPRSRPAPMLLSMIPKARMPSVAVSAMPATEDAVAVARIFVGLLENTREGLRGHSAQVGQLCDDVCYRLQLPREISSAIVMAGLIHDLGKVEHGGGRSARAARPHLTPLNVAQFRAFQAVAADFVLLPSQLMATAGLSSDTKSALEGMYERFDGKGIPQGVAASAIPLGARILAIADTFADLTRNPKNTFDRVLSSAEAIEVIRKHSGSVFDPKVVDVFGQATKGEAIAAQLLEDRGTVLLIDPNLDEILALQLALTEEGLDVRSARTTEEARCELDAHTFTLVVSEVDLETRGAGLTLCEEVTGGAARSGPCWVFLSHRRDKDTAKRAFEQGASDVITKPAAMEIMVAKLTQLSKRAPLDKPPSTTGRGVHGFLADMTMVDLVQVLHYGQRTGKLRVEWADTFGEIHFSDGKLMHAFVDELEAENAIYRMLAKGNDGKFTVDPAFVPGDEPTITISADGILLEGMRLLDEGITP